MDEIIESKRSKNTEHASSGKSERSFDEVSK